MKIVFAASEAVPFCKTGGLADVVGALSETLAIKRHSVRLILPLYQDVRQRFPAIRPSGHSIRFSFDGKKESAELWQLTVRPNLIAVFIQHSGFFDRPGIYGETPSSFYLDNDRRYAFFSRAVLETCKALDFKPDIVHGHDWQTGLLMAYRKLLYGADPFFGKTSTVFTIHNLAYQGNFPAPAFHMTGLPPSAFDIKGLEFYGNISFLKAGLVYAHAVNTVSPTYAKEISTDPAFGCGMEGILKERSADFQGILNGLDVDFWDPKTDKNLAANFDPATLDKRALCKEDLQKAAGLPVDGGVALLAFIGRLDYQKGVDLLIEGMPSLLKDNVQLVNLGQGNLQYTKDLRDLESRFPGQVHVKTDFAEAFAHKIYAGADIFLMPSRYEPCGLSQMIAMRYGAVPVVTPTGGLMDTVRDARQSRIGTGFIADDLSSGDFFAAMRTALELFEKKERWREIQACAMREDFSWRHSVKDYLLLYESLLS